MRSRLLKSQIKSNIQSVAETVQYLVNVEFEKVNYEPIENSPLDQEGLKDGIEIIKEYLDVGENGIAFEHIIYMIDEINIIVPLSDSNLILELSKKLDISVDGIRNKMEK